MTTKGDTSSPGGSHRGRRPRITGRHIALMSGVLVPLAALAFFLSPTGHANYRNAVQVNGVTLSVPAGISVSELSEYSALVARAGSRLDVAGDVITIGAGLDAIRQSNGEPLDETRELADGTLVSVRHGESVLEVVEKTTEEIPFEEVVTGEGKIVSFVQTGAPGQQEVYWGASTGKRAASIVVLAAQNTIFERTATPQPGQKLAALTFDDGPGTHTQEVLDALAAKHVYATFFVLGNIAAGHKDIIAEEKAAGHEVENHTWNHPWLTRVSAGEFSSQISRTNNVIGGSQFLRPPYGDTNARVRAQAAAMGLRTVMWTVDTRDWELQDVDAILSHVKAEIGQDAIILMHDGGADRLQTVAAVPVVIDWLFSQGYSLTTVDQIL